MAKNILPQFSAPVLSIENLRTKFDTAIVSNSLVALIGDFIEARIIQQLHYWTFQEQGVVLKDRRWIFKPVREWLEEVMIGFSTWQIRKAIASLVQKGLLLKDQLHKEHFGHNYNPKNRTCYYSLDYEKLAELVSKHELAETIETDRFVSPTKEVCGELTNGVCENTQNKTENTINEHNQRTHQPPYRGDPKISVPEPKPEQEKINLSPSDKSNKIERKIDKPRVINKFPDVLINESTKQKFAELNIPLTRRVLKAIADHHESQVLAILNRIYMGFETIKNPEDFFCSKISEEKKEHLGAFGLDVSARMAQEDERIAAERASLEYIADLANQSPFLKNRKKQKKNKGFAK